MNPSLIITPNAYKAGKLYSIVPTDGAGDLDVVRETNATRVNSNGLIETVGNNIPRLDYSNGSCPSILVEPQRTNLILQSEDFSDASWTSIATVNTNTDVSPSGILNADTITDGTTVYRDRRQTITITPNATYTSSVFIKKTTGTLTSYPALANVFSGVSNRAIYLGINTTTGELAYINASSSPLPSSFSSSIQSYGDYWRVTLTTQDNQSNTTLLYFIYPALSTDFIVGDTGATGSAVFWGAQLEVGTDATSYIPTTTSTVTRNADIIGNVDALNLIGQSEGSIFVEFYYDKQRPEQTSVFSIRDIGSGGSASYLFRCRINGAGANNFDSFYVNNGASESNVIPYPVLLDSINKIVITYDYSTKTTRFYLNGAFINEVTNTLAYPTNQDKIWVGNWFSSVVKLEYKQLVFWKTKITDAQAIQLTTL